MFILENLSNAKKSLLIPKKKKIKLSDLFNNYSKPKAKPKAKAKTQRVSHHIPKSRY